MTPGVATPYAGVRFRSRLEARWAALFDALGWKWSYEPLDLSGYIPDFVVTFPHAPVLVEVKPAMFVRELHDAMPKILASGWGGEAIVVGATFWSDTWQGPVIGIVAERDCGEWVPAADAQSFHCLTCDHISFRSVTGSWHCRYCGAADRNHTAAHFADKWLDAANKVQWRAA